LKFLNPWGLLALSAIPVLIVLYILKQKHKVQKVPSLYLWRKTRVMLEATTPFQKLKRSLLFILQLLSVLILALAIARPVLNSTHVFDEAIVIIDASASMQAEDGDSTRFERAIDECLKIADGLGNGKKMSVIIAKDTVFPVVSHSESKYEIKNALKSAKCGYGTADIESAVLLADSMRSENSNCEIRVYTDFSYDDGNSYLKYINMSLSYDNKAVLNLKTGYASSGLSALSTVESFGSDCDVTLELLADGLIFDAKNLSLKAGEAQNVYWYNLPEDAELITVRFTEDDVLNSDNSLSAAVVKDADRSVLVVSESGFFWEKALSAVCSYKIYKCTPDDYDASQIDKYDLIIFDCCTPEQIPESCAAWLINPSLDVPEVTFGSVIKGSTLRAGSGKFASELCEYVNPTSIILSQFREMTADGDWMTALYCGEYPVVFGKENSSGLILTVFSFDIHDSNLPLLKEFPILIQNLLSYSLPRMADGDGIHECGDSVNVRILPYSVSTEVERPDKKTISLGDERMLSLDIPGVYRITQNIERNGDDGKKSEQTAACLCARIPASESAMENSAASVTDSKISEYKGQLDLRPYLCIALLCLLAAEWWVYNRES